MHGQHKNGVIALAAGFSPVNALYNLRTLTFRKAFDAFAPYRNFHKKNAVQSDGDESL